MIIKTFKTVAGDELVGEIVTETADTITVKAPCGVQVVGVDQHNNLQIRLLPFTILDPDGERTFYKSNILTEPTDVPKQVETMYIQQHTSIQLLNP